MLLSMRGTFFIHPHWKLIFLGNINPTSPLHPPEPKVDLEKFNNEKKFLKCHLANKSIFKKVEKWEFSLWQHLEGVTKANEELIVMESWWNEKRLIDTTSSFFYQLSNKKWNFMRIGYRKHVTLCIPPLWVLNLLSQKKTQIMLQRVNFSETLINIFFSFLHISSIINSRKKVWRSHPGAVEWKSF